MEHPYALLNYSTVFISPSSHTDRLLSGDRGTLSEITRRVPETVRGTTHTSFSTILLRKPLYQNGKSPLPWSLGGYPEGEETGAVPPRPSSVLASTETPRSSPVTYPSGLTTGPGRH